MSSQKGNVSRSRGQKHQNATAFKNDKYGASVQVKVSIVLKCLSYLRNTTIVCKLELNFI